MARHLPELIATTGENKMKTIRNILALVLMGCLSTAVQAGNDGFSIGLTGGISDYVFQDEGNNFPKHDEQGPSWGIAARYTVPVGERSFIGVHFGFRRETAELDNNDDRWDYHRGNNKTDWSGDLMARFGTDFGRVSPYIAGGVSMARSTIEVLPGDFSLGINKSATYTGWKVAVGADVDLSERLSMFVQAEHADYGSENYTDEIRGALTQQALRLGLMLNF